MGEESPVCGHFILRKIRGINAMSLKQIRLSAQAKDQLIRLKTKTGIGQWNILCRWAFCLSLRQPTPPTPLDVPADSNVEMTWQVFGGDAQELYLALLTERCARDGLGTAADVLARQFRLHLHRGISYLATPHLVRSAADLIRIALDGDAAAHPA
jgi:DNA sulfur modification protein DndE